MTMDSNHSLPEYHQDTLPQGSITKAIIGGALFGLIGSTMWASVAYFTNYKIGWLAIGIGFIVGIGIRFMGKGSGEKYKLIGAAIALLSCIVGDYFTVVAFASKEMNEGLLDAFSAIPLTQLPEIIKLSFTPMDIVFYGLSAWCGWKYSSGDGQ